MTQEFRRLQICGEPQDPQDHIFGGSNLADGGKVLCHPKRGKQSNLPGKCDVCCRAHGCRKGASELRRCATETIVFLRISGHGVFVYDEMTGKPQKAA